MVDRRLFLQRFTLSSAALILPVRTLASIPNSSYLQRVVNSEVARLRRRGFISPNETTAWSVYDFKTKSKLVSINENRYMQAASMVKVFIGLAYFYLHKIAPKKYPYASSQRDLMEKMIVHSNNTASNKLMKLCGGPGNVKRLCQAATGNRFKQLHIVEYIPANGRTYRNKISARDYSRFLYALWHNQLPYAKELKRIMSIPNPDRIRGNTIPANIKITDKTGSTALLCGDMGIVHNNNKSYTFIGIIQSDRRASNYHRWLTKRSAAMRTVSAVVYKQMVNRYRRLSQIKLVS